MISLATRPRRSGLQSFTNTDSFRFDINELNQHLTKTSAREAIDWAASQFGNELVMTTSFGIQSAVMLHLATRIKQPLFCKFPGIDFSDFIFGR